MINAKFQHFGIAVNDLDKAIGIYEKVFGYRLLSGPFADPVQRSTVCFIGKTEQKIMIELIAPLGKDSFVHKIVSKEMGIYHVCYQVEDLEKTLSFVIEQGCHVVSRPVPAVAFNGKRIAWFYMPTHQLVEVVEP